MASQAHYPSELDSVDAGSDVSSHELQQRVRFMCSFGGKILPRPHDNQLRYVGGDTRIVAVNRHGTVFSALLGKLSKLSGISCVSIKYQLPSEDLDALISVANDEDVENMMEEYDRLALSVGSKMARLRLFLFEVGGDVSRTSSISSLLDGSTGRESWFFDALNGGASRLERGRSEVSSIVSEVPDYLFGLETSDEAQQREPRFKRSVLSENVSVSDPGSPAPVVSSPFCSASSSSCVPNIPDLPPVKTKPDSPAPAFVSNEKQSDGHVGTEEVPVPQSNGYAGNMNPMWHYVPESQYPGPAVQPMQVYYVPGPVPPHSNVPVQQLPIRAQYVQQFQPPAGQIPVGFHQPVQGMNQVYGGVRQTVGLDPYDAAARGIVSSDGLNQQVYYGVQNGGMVPVYPGMTVPGGEELQLHRTASDVKGGRVNQ